METAEDDGGAGARQEQSDGVNGARSKHRTLARHEYNILASEATERGQSSAGADRGGDSHEASEEREGPGAEKEGYKTPQLALPAQEPDGGQTEARAPPRMVTGA